MDFFSIILFLGLYYIRPQEWIPGADSLQLLRVAVGMDGGVQLAGAQTSHSVNSLARANGLVDLAAGAVWEAGKVVPVIRWA